jgi:DNA replication protein DnaC
MQITRNSSPVIITPDILRLMNIGQEFAGVSLDAVPAGGEECVSDVRTYLSNIVDAFASGFGLVLSGLSQSGKTSLAVVIAKYVYSFYTPVNGVYLLQMNRITRTFLVDNRGLQRVEKKGLLIIDDLGSEKTSDYGESVVESILRYRCENLLPTITTTNMDVSSIKTKYGEVTYKQLIRKSKFIVMKEKVNWSGKNVEKVLAFFSRGSK